MLIAEHRINSNIERLDAVIYSRSWLLLPGFSLNPLHFEFLFYYHRVFLLWFSLPCLFVFLCYRCLCCFIQINFPLLLAVRLSRSSNHLFKYQSNPYINASPSPNTVYLRTFLESFSFSNPENSIYSFLLNIDFFPLFLFSFFLIAWYREIGWKNKCECMKQLLWNSPWHPLSANRKKVYSPKFG